MDIEGRIIQDLGIQQGTSKAGNPWKKREMVLETFGNYPRKVKFHIFGDRVDTINIEIGKDYILSFDLESREFNGRWYTDVSVFRAAERVGGPNAAFAPAAHPQTGGPTVMGEPSMPFSDGGNAFSSGGYDLDSSGSDEDLPF